MNEQTKPDTRAMEQEMAEMVVGQKDSEHGTIPVLWELAESADLNNLWEVCWALELAALRMGWKVYVGDGGGVEIETMKDKYAEWIYDPATNLICAMYEAVKGNVE